MDSFGDLDMKKNCIIYGIITLFFLASFSGCVGPQATEYFNESYVVDDQTILTVTNINGHVEITGWNRNNVSINAVKKSSFGKEELDKIQINVSMNGNYLHITTKYLGLSSIQGSVDLNIKVPRNVQIESVTSSNGPIQLTQTKGNTTVESSNGGIFIDTVEGYVSAESSNGQIQVKGTTGIGNLRTSNGPIVAEVSDFQQDITIETSNGAVTISLNPSLNASVEMMTSNSQITIEGIALNIELLETTHVIGSLGSNGHEIDIRTSNGKIKLLKLLTE